MFKSLLQDTRMLLLLLAVVLLKVFSAVPGWVERYYTYGVYPYIARLQRLLFGWLPFSFGDLLYAAAGLYLIWAVVRLVQLVRKRGLRGHLRTISYRVLTTAIWVYLVFNLCWGLNYNRLGIAHQLGLSKATYTEAEVKALAELLQERLNAAATLVDTNDRQKLNSLAFLRRQTVQAYQTAGKEWPFLQYRNVSLKSSLYSPVAHFIGYTGYYNPFSGEAQLNTAVPTFLLPFVACHEVGHQLGYGRENEANFIAFLSSKTSADPHFRYALYFDLFRYAFRELYRVDTVQAAALREQLHPLVLRDNQELQAYFLRTENPIEPLASAFYDQYLKWNRQSKGLRTYNEVVGLLIAYQRKYGKERI